VVQEVACSGRKAGRKKGRKVGGCSGWAGRGAGKAGRQKVWDPCSSAKGKRRAGGGREGKENPAIEGAQAGEATENRQDRRGRHRQACEWRKAGRTGPAHDPAAAEPATVGQGEGMNG